MRSQISIALLILAVVAGASAQTVYVPAAANADGAEGTQWHTDLEVKGKGGEGASFTVELLRRGASNTEPPSAQFSVEPNHSLRLRDVIAEVFEFTGSAALRLTATDGEILVTSRTFNDDPGGTYGQFVPAFDEDEAVSFGTTVSFLQLSHSPAAAGGFRTNMGLVNVSAESVIVVIDLYSADGASLGTVERTLQPFEYKQVNYVFAEVGVTELDAGYAMVRTTTENGRFMAYASVVDNRSGDAILITAQVDEVESQQPQEKSVIFEIFTRDGCGICGSAGPVVDQVAEEYAGQNAVFLEQNVDAPLGGRLDRWWSGYSGSGSVLLPVWMVDSGDQTNNGEQNFDTVFRNMVDTALAREPGARIEVERRRDGNYLRFDVQLTNLSGIPLASGTEATLQALAYEDNGKGVTNRVISAITSIEIVDLLPGETRDYEINLYVGSSNWSRLHTVVFAEYRPGGRSGPYDMLQAAMQGPVE